MTHPEIIDASVCYARQSISFAPDWQRAVEEAVSDVMAGANSAPDLTVMFVASAWSEHYPHIVSQVTGLTGTESLIGCSSSGVIGGATCHESAPGLSLMCMWLPGATLSPVRLQGDPTVWPWADDAPVDSVRGVLMFADPYQADAQSQLVGLRSNAPGVTMIGGLASTARNDHRAWVFLDNQVYADGAVALAIQGPYDLIADVSQGGTPIGEPWTVSSADHNRIHSISHVPALLRMQQALDSVESSDHPERHLLVGFPMSEYQDQFEREDFVARGILEEDEDDLSIVVGCVPRIGQSIQFLVRDAELASLDLDNRLDEFRNIDQHVVGGILCSCKGRGTSMFGRDDHDATAVADAFPDIPFVGFYSLGELGPVCGIPAFNAFACCLGLIVRRG